MAGDADYGSVSLLLQGNGANGSTTIPDLSPSPKTVTVVGGAAISTAQSKFGGASIHLDGSGDYLSVAYNSAFSLVSGDFTIEAWVYVVALTATEMSVVNKDGVAGASYPQYGLSVGSDGKLSGWLGNGNGVSPTGSAYTGTTAITTGAWHHVAMVKSGSTCMGFLDGALEWSAAAAAMYEGSKPLLVGYHTDQPSSLFFNGYIDDLRITKGVARYTSAFSVPTAELPAGMGQVSGTVRDSSGALCARTVRAYRRDTGALVASAVSDASTGVYQFMAPTLDELTVIALDNATSGTYYNDQAIRVIPA